MVTINPSEIKKLYFVGIKGVGMASLAVIAKEAGFIVGGSDVGEEFITDEILADAHIKIDVGFEPRDLERFSARDHLKTIIVTTAAHGGLNNPQSKFAQENNFTVLTHGQAVGYFMQGDLFHKKFKGVSVLGCHGKTTITALAATALTESGLSPTYTIGTSEVFPLGPGGHFGKGEIFVAEADEFISDVEHDRTVKFLYQYPHYAIVNNIDFDHPDVYKDLNEVKEIFQKFCLENIKQNGTLIINGDDENCRSLREAVKTKRPDLEVITYGEDKENIAKISEFKEVGWGSEFTVYFKGDILGTFSLSVPGYHNAKNALSVISLLLTLGVSPEKIKSSIKEFRGTKRRQEKVGETKNGGIVIDDYAHHPDEIEKTLAAIRKAFPEKKIACLFQPHTLSRTEALWKEFVNSFKNADEVLFLPIFTSKREGETNYDALYNNIRAEMEKTGVKVTFLNDRREREELGNSPYFFSKNRAPVVEYIESHFNSSQWIIVTLGAGDLYRIGYDLVNKK